jgi:hypothetical protein
MVISETATAGFVRRLVTEHLPGLLRDHDPRASKSTLKGASSPLGGMAWDTAETHVATPGLRNQMTLLCDLLAEHGTGLLLTLDEIHHQHLDELRELATTLQHLLRESHNIAFAGAGLPAAVSEVLSDNVLTFLRRADRHHLGPVPLEEVAEAIAVPTADSGRSIDPALSQRAAEATAGYPFLIQLIGHHIWRLHPHVVKISAADVEQGIAAARRRLGALVLEPALADLSDVDRTFLMAMAHDDGPSKMGDIGERLGVDTNYTGQYRLRLIAAGMIERTGHGRVAFSMPYLRDHLREHGALDAQRGFDPGI